MARTPKPKPDRKAKGPAREDRRATKKRGKDKGRERDPYSAIYEEAEEVPVASLDDQVRAGSKVFRRIRRILLLTPVLLVISMIFNLFIGMAWVNTWQDPDAGAIQEVQATEVGRTQAESALQSWLDAERSAFEGALIASWDGVSDRLEVPEIDGEPPMTLITHNFTIRSKDGTYLRADVRVAYAEGRGAKVVSQPSILPLSPTAVGEWNPQVIPVGWAEVNASEDVTGAIKAWSTALTGNPEDLKLAVRDENPSTVYSTLQGVQLVDAHVTSAMAPADGNGQVKDNTMMVATVTLTFASPADPDASPNDPQPAPTQVQYDVLVRGADTAAPYVSAWGGVDSGVSLTDHMNGVTLAGEADDPEDSRLPEQTDPADGADVDPGADTEGATDDENPAPSDGGGKED